MITTVYPDSKNMEMSALLQNVLQKPKEYSFFDLLRILKKELPESTQVNLLANTDFSSSNKEIQNVQKKDSTWEAQLNLTSLYGKNSIHTQDTSEKLLNEKLQGEQKSLIPLLDIFQQKLFLLYFKAHKKYSLLYSIIEDQSKQHIDILSKLLGIPKALLHQHPNPKSLLRYIDLFSQNTRSAQGLKTLLQDALKKINIEVQQCVPRTVSIKKEQQTALGDRKKKLGQNMMLGQQILDVNGKCAITFGPLQQYDVIQLLNETNTFKNIRFLIQAYMPFPFECELIFKAKASEVQTTQIGVFQWATLGKNTWLTNSKKNQSLTAKLILPYSEDNPSQKEKLILNLKKVQIFQNFSDEDLHKIINNTKQHHFEPKQTIVTQGEEANSMFILIQGFVSVKIQLNNNKIKEVARLSPGSFFGEMALLSGNKRNASITTISPAYVIEVSREQLKQLLLTKPQLKQQINNTFNSRSLHQT